MLYNRFDKKTLGVKLLDQVEMSKPSDKKGALVEMAERPSEPTQLLADITHQ